VRRGRIPSSLSPIGVNLYFFSTFCGKHALSKALPERFSSQAPCLRGPEHPTSTPSGNKSRPLAEQPPGPRSTAPPSRWACSAPHQPDAQARARRPRRAGLAWPEHSLALRVKAPHASIAHAPCILARSASEGPGRSPRWRFGLALGGRLFRAFDSFVTRSRMTVRVHRGGVLRGAHGPRSAVSLVRGRIDGVVQRNPLPALAFRWVTQR
jgi:hypothetical protein